MLNLSEIMHYYYISIVFCLMDYCKHINRNLAYLNTFNQYAMYAMIYFIHKFTKFNELYEIIMIEIYCLILLFYD